MSRNRFIGTRKIIPVEQTQYGTKITIDSRFPIVYDGYRNYRGRKTSNTEIIIGQCLLELSSDSRARLDILELILRHALIDHIGDSSHFFLVEHILAGINQPDCFTAILSQCAFDEFKKKSQLGTLPIITFNKSSDDTNTLVIYIAKTNDEKRELTSFRDGGTKLEFFTTLNQQAYWQMTWYANRAPYATFSGTINDTPQQINKIR